MVKLNVYDVSDQRQALKALAELAQRSAMHPRVQMAALAITNDLPARDDAAEVNAIFNAVKHGDPRVKGLERGVRYVSDPRWADTFRAPNRVLQMCASGSCGGDCDDHTALVVAMLAAIGFRAGLRAWGPKGSGEYTHVYPVVGLPKRDPTEAYGLDTTVPESDVGWEPPNGEILTAWLE